MAYCVRHEPVVRCASVGDGKVLGSQAQPQLQEKRWVCFDDSRVLGGLVEGCGTCGTGVADARCPVLPPGLRKREREIAAALCVVGLAERVWGSPFLSGPPFSPQFSIFFHLFLSWCE